MRRTGRRRCAALPVLGFMLCLGSCAPAMRRPPSLTELAGLEEPPPAAEGPVLLERGRSLLDSERPEDLRLAAVWLTAAAASGVTGALPLAVQARIRLAETAEDPGVRAKEATAAVQTAQWCAELRGQDPECDYWLAAALGVQARERRATGLDALPKIEALFRRAAEAAPELDHAGPYRALALFYLRAPAWPTGPGDEELGLDYARRAVEMEPDYPPNLMALAEALVRNGAREEAVTTYRRALAAARRALEEGRPGARRWVDEIQAALERLGVGPGGNSLHRPDGAE